MSTPRMSTSVGLPLPDYFTLGTSNVKFSETVKVGVALDRQMAMNTQVVNLIRTANQRVSSICHYISAEATRTLVSSFVLSRLDY